ncbi:hypothetical protein LCGC14_0175740 [marine sediment metagenome]|uniref:AAA+ ATPase domain-containing protein n=1 Tax=marine sediment metagenome TaxID=412755 RepID=A0A0F9URD9_9ZZZZ
MSQYDNKTLTDIKEAILASPRSPLLAFIGVDAKAYFRSVQSVFGQVMQEGDLDHIAMISISATEGIETNFDAGVDYLSPRVPEETYAGEFKDRLIVFYSYASAKAYDELNSINHLYEGDMSEDGLITIAKRLNLGNLTGLDALKQMATKQKNNIDIIPFIRFFGSRLPFFFFVNVNSSPSIFPRNVTNPQSNDALIRAYDLLDDSINALTSGKSFGDVKFKEKSSDEELIYGYSNLVVFALDDEDINERILRKEYAYTHKCFFPEPEQREWIIAGLLEEKQDEYLDSEPMIQFKIKPIPREEWNGGEQEYRQLITSIGGNTAGLDSIQLEQAVLKGIEYQVREQHLLELEEDPSVKEFEVEIDIEPFNKFREEILNQYDFLQIPDTSHTLDDVAGHTLNKEIIRTYIIEMVKRPDRRKFMKNFLALVGVPGTGKTWLVGAVANELKKYGYIFLVFLLNSLKEGIVGASNKKAKLAFQIADSCGYAVLFFDEVDMITSGRESQGDSGVSSGIQQQLMKWSENKDKFTGKQIVASATNRPDLVEGAFWDRISRDGVLNFEPLDKFGIGELVALKLNKFEKDSPEFTYNKINTYEELGQKIYDIRPELMGRPLVSMIEWIRDTAIVRADEANTTELTFSIELVGEVMGETTSRGMSEEVEKMREVCESYAFFKTDASLEALLGTKSRKVKSTKKKSTTKKKKSPTKKIDLKKIK